MGAFSHWKVTERRPLWGVARIQIRTSILLPENPEKGKPKAAEATPPKMKTTINKFGWIPDIPDSRDHLYRSIRPSVRLPKEVNLVNQCSPVEDQGRLGSCTAQALAG